MNLIIPTLALLLSCSGQEYEDGTESPIDALLGLSDANAKANHSLSRLSILTKDFALLKANYVDSADLKSAKLQEMFEAALERVEWNVDEAYFVYVSEKNLLHMTVGGASETIPVTEFNRFEDLLVAFQNVAIYLDANLHESTDRAAVEYHLINGAFSKLDPHTLLLPPVQAAEMELDNQGEFGGLGIQITTINGELTVKEPIDDTPAFRAGLKADDKIVRIENSSTINMDLTEAVSLLRGEIGAPVNIMVMRKGWSKPRLFNIIRGRIRIDPVKSDWLGNGIGYIRIQAFNANVSKDLAAYLEEFSSKENFNGLILDLRSNPGGYLDQAFKVSDMFLDSGVIVSTVEGSERKRDELLARRSNSYTDLPIVVLMNGSSASASEIVAGAIRNRNRGIIVGERSFGKGSVQHLYSNPDGSQLKLTVAQYLTPGDRSIQSVGIPPDVYLEQSTVRPSVDDSEPLVSLYWREWLQREADLDRHLENEATLNAETSYTLRYLVPNREEGTKPSPKDDWEVQFASKLLLEAPFSERARQLKGISPVISKVREEQSLSLSSAFNKIGINWNGGEYPQTPQLDIQFSSATEQLRAGVEENLEVTVTNNGDEDFHQLSLMTTSDNPALDHQEFYIGQLKSGESQVASQIIQLPYGYGSEVSEIHVEGRAPGVRNIIQQDLLVETKGSDLPSLFVDITLNDSNGEVTKGNGNGIPEQGEVVSLSVEVENVGQGKTRDAFVRLKNTSRKSLDLIEGTIEVGQWKNDQGQDCEANSEGCYRELLPGEKTTDQFLVELREPINESWDLEIIVGDNRAYDYDSIVRGGFGSYFQQKTPVILSNTDAFAALSIHPPQIEVRTDSPLKTSSNHHTVSGVVTDDKGIKDLIVFHNDDKVYYRSEELGTSVAPFSTEVTLDAGLNQLHILVKDNEGLHQTRTVNIWKE